MKAVKLDGRHDCGLGSSAMASPCLLLGEGITDDTLLHIDSFLPAAKDLLCLQLSCPRFAAKIIAVPCPAARAQEGVPWQRQRRRGCPS